ncbi:MAG: WYL domain [Phormidesmis priestleyi Ana]|uniref:WYL domain n=1 Tax=Phormidesmis priestleyi Ana TaxID=1666911 RepID=A0A0P7ZJX0_9CYAN|nr:MAG: WYL domain [Phormidesmis priestleyi Ana]
MPFAYSEQSAFERLLLLIATFVQYPGIGSAESGAQDSARDAFEVIQEKMQAISQTCDIDLPLYSAHTLRKDLKTLRQYGILERRMYRWGYYLGTGAMSRDELQTALQSLAAHAKSQRDPNVRRVFQTLEQRLRGLNLESAGQLFYPVRTQLDRAIVYADPEEMMNKGQYRHTLFHQLIGLETAIFQGQVVKLYRQRDPYSQINVGYIQVYPLQLIYVDIAWYLLYEDQSTQHLEVERVDRFSDFLTVVDPNGRGLPAQQQSLQTAHKLLSNGWGLYLGNAAEQSKERAGQLDYVEVWVKFFPPVMNFILEGDRRHPKQKVQKRTKGQETHVDYKIKLPARSLNEFCYWVHRFMQYAQIISPQSLVEQHHQAALALAKRYET